MFRTHGLIVNDEIERGRDVIAIERSDYALAAFGIAGDDDFVRRVDLGQIDFGLVLQRSLDCIRRRPQRVDLPEWFGIIIDRQMPKVSYRFFPATKSLLKER